jgi:hypothetical protein
MRLGSSRAARKRTAQRREHASMVKVQGTCPFCGGLGMTKQHVFGRRFLGLLDGRLGQHLAIERLPSGTTTKKREGNVWSKQVRKVCRGCNGGWMRELEESTFAMMSQLIAGRAHISRTECRQISARIAQMAMVASLDIPDEKQPISRHDMAYLRATGVPPPHWLIFLARVDVTVEVGQFYYGDAFNVLMVGEGNRMVLARSPPSYSENYASIR